MKLTREFRTTQTRTPLPGYPIFKYVSPEGLEVINATGAFAERAYDDLQRREDLKNPLYRER